MKTLAQNLFINPGSNNQVGISGPLSPNIRNLGDLVSLLMQFLVPLAAVILFFVLVSGGFDLLLSQGNPEKFKTARAKITTGVIGFALLIGSYIVVRIIVGIFGLETGII